MIANGGNMKGSLILMRHGRSKWNALNIFTGWVDVPLNLEGICRMVQRSSLSRGE